MSAGKKILVTGASGFIGGWIAESLYLGGLFDVRAGIRSWSSGARLGRFPLEVRLCNILDKEEIARAMDGVTHVVHCAKGWNDVIIQGTANMLELAERNGVRRFVHLSTAEVYGNPSGEIGEDHPLQYTGNAYADSKIEAEKLCWRAVERGLPVTVIRPSIVYGPFSTDWTIRFALSLQSGRWGIFEGYGEGICNIIYVSDLVRGVVRALQKDEAAGQAFNLNGPDVITWNQYLERFNSALGFPDLRVIRPGAARLRSSLMSPVRSVARFGAYHFRNVLQKIAWKSRLAKRMMKSAEGAIKTTPRFEELKLFNRKAVYVQEKAKNLLGYEPEFDLERGLRLSVAWLRQAGLVDSAGPES